MVFLIIHSLYYCNISYTTYPRPQITLLRLFLLRKDRLHLQVCISVAEVSLYLPWWIYSSSWVCGFNGLSWKCWGSHLLVRSLDLISRLPPELGLEQGSCMINDSDGLYRGVLRVYINILQLNTITWNPALNHRNLSFISHC